jgi:subtilisin-like proprotein convertase family protein
MAILQQEKASRTPTQQKMSSRLLMALRKYHQDPIFAALPDYQTLAPDADGFILVDIDITTADAIKPVLAMLGKMNAQIIYQSAGQRTIRARMPLALTELLAASPDVAYVRDADVAVTNGPNQAAGVRSPTITNVSEADVTHQAMLARQLYGVSGAGEKICALSDGVDSLANSQATGDLPPNVEILPGQAGSGDEGTAMLELIHDLAPAAMLGFATGVNGASSFAQNIRDLQTAGCTIIVDDLSYFIESPFQDNEIAQAVIDVTNAGAMYFSSAANDGNLDSNRSGTWEGDFNPNGQIDILSGGTVHNFGDGGRSDAFTSSASYVLMHWTDPFGASGNDYDLYVLNSDLTSVLASSTDIQNGDGTPYEFISGGFDSGDRVVVFRKDGSAGRMLNVIAWRSTLQFATSGATRGHSAAPLAFSVAAVPAHGAWASGGPTGPYPNPFTTADMVEWFSSDGPRRIFFGFDGALLPTAPAGNYSATGGVMRQKPDIAAADGTVTSVPGFEPFFGTSAAAPHAAAIAGLLKEAFPLSSTLEIRGLLQATALDIMSPGVDRSSGYGIVMPVAALQAGNAQPRAILTLGSHTANEVEGNGDAYIDPNETWQLYIPISNTGAAGSSALSATLLASTPNVQILAAASTYPDLPPGAAGVNASGFVIQLGPNAICGTSVPFTLTTVYQDTASRIAALNYTLPTGAMSSTATSFHYTGPVVPIPDFSSPPVTATASLSVTSLPGTIGRLVFSIDGTDCATNTATTAGVDHTYDGDLSFALHAPDGSQFSIIESVGVGGDNFCQTVLDDSAVNSIQDVGPDSAPFTGVFKPNVALAHFGGHTANGHWQLRVTDRGIGDTGHIRAFSLHIWPLTCQTYAPIFPINGLAATSSSPSPLGAVTAFTATVVSGTEPITYTWDLGDGAIGSGAYFTHTYTAAGVYTAIVTATNVANSLTAQTTVSVTIAPISGLAATSSSPTTLGAATTFTATVVSGTKPITYTWDLGDGAIGSGAQITHTYTATGVYTATVTATNVVNALGAQTIVAVNEPPIIPRVYLPGIFRTEAVSPAQSGDE